MTDDLISVPEAAEELKLSRVHVWRLCSAGLLGRRIVGRYLITRRELARFKKIPRRKAGRPKKGVLK